MREDEQDKKDSVINPKVGNTQTNHEERWRGAFGK